LYRVFHKAATDRHTAVPVRCTESAQVRYWYGPVNAVYLTQMKAAEALQLSAMRLAVRTGRAKALRVHGDLSQSEVARVCGVQPAAVSRWENAERLPRGIPARRYARLLERLEEQAARLNDNAHDRVE
jgi:DNA-binding transcriptional regulator YiaG